MYGKVDYFLGRKATSLKSTPGPGMSECMCSRDLPELGSSNLALLSKKMV